VPEAQTITYIPGYWQDGVTAPGRPHHQATWE
jgi:LacI family transcriptional regulator